MKKINVPVKEQVSADAQILFDKIQKGLGKVPNLYATIGYSANALKGYLDFEGALSNGVFTPKEREAISLIVSEVNSCDYCLAAHTMLATMKGFTKEETLLLRKGIAKDLKLNTALRLAKSITENKGKADTALIDAFFDAGYNETALIELIGLVTGKIFTNYVYALTNVPVDFPAAQPLN
jgi:AhpD family alkylhydroperoxidase